MSQDKFAHRFFLVSLAVFSIAGGLAYVLIHLSRSPVTDTAALVLPPAFWLSTLLLIAGSAALHHSLRLVRVEKQRPFRRFLLIALAAETLFVSVQSYGLWCLLQNQRVSSEASTGVHAFVFVFAVLHALHVTVSLLFLVFVTLRGFANRYDHEYYWGVTVCAFFWHFLGAVWICILGVFAVASKSS